MRTSTRRASVLALTVLLAPAGNVAQAQEMLVMPYACSMMGGRPMLSPAPEQGHRIFGQREQKTFTACSQANPDMCRSWTVHRFDLDCDGMRVPWVSVVGAAAEQGNARAWVEDGRMRVRMGWQWGLEPDDPCARGPGFDDRFGFGRMRRYCADRRAMMPPPVVEMPFGFAPMLGIEGIFVKAATPAAGPVPSTLPPISAGPTSPRTARTEPPPPAWPEPSVTTRASEPPSGVLVPPQATEAPPRSQPAPQPQVAATQPPPQAVIPPAPQPATPPPPFKEAAPVKAPPAPQAAPAPKPAPAAAAPTAPPGGPIIPKIINRPEPTPPAEASAPAATAVAKTEPGTEPPVKVAAAPQPGEAARTDAAADTTSERGGASVTVSLLSVARSPVTGAIAVFAGLTFGLLTAFIVARRREQVRFAGAGSRDIGSVSLHGKAKRAQPVPRLGSSSQVPPNAAASAMYRVPAASQPPPGGQGVPASWGNDMPRTRTEAMEVLGMGVTPDAGDTALKKIVDGLRLTWHPDLAKDEADRQLRELRLKQINAAWEIIQGRRGEV